MYFEKVLGGERRGIVDCFSLFCFLVFRNFPLFYCYPNLEPIPAHNKGTEKAEFLNPPVGELFVHIFRFLSGFGLSFYSKGAISWLTYWSGRTQGSCRPGTRQAGWLRGESCCFSLPAADKSAVRIPLVQESVVVLHATFIGVVTG